MENLTLKGDIKRKRNRRKQQIVYLPICANGGRITTKNGLKGKILTRVTRDRMLWRDMLSHILKGNGIKRKCWKLSNRKDVEHGKEY